MSSTDLLKRMADFEHSLLMAALETQELLDYVRMEELCTL